MLGDRWILNHAISLFLYGPRVAWAFGPDRYPPTSRDFKLRHYPWMNRTGEDARVYMCSELRFSNLPSGTLLRAEGE